MAKPIAPRFCPDCKRGDTYHDCYCGHAPVLHTGGACIVRNSEGPCGCQAYEADASVVRATYPPIRQAMLPLTTPAGQVVEPHEYGVCTECHAKQYAKFYEIENIKNPRPTVVDVYALTEMLPPMNQVPTIEITGTPVSKATVAAPV